MPSHLRTSEPRAHDLQTELRQRGLPLVLGARDRLSGLVPRCAPALFAALIVFLGINLMAEGLQEVTDEGPLPTSDTKALAVGAGMLVLAFFPVGWWLLHVILRHTPDVVGSVLRVALVVALLGLPLLDTGDLKVRFSDGVIVVALILLATYWGVGDVTSWASRRAARELSHLGSMVGRVLPILMLALLFSFFNAEIWQVVAQLSMGRTWAVVGVMCALGIALATLNAKDEISDIIRTYDAREDGRDLRPLERANITVMCVSISLIQVTLLAVVVFVFYVVFGVLPVSPVTATQWIGSPPIQFGGIFANLPVTQPLVQVCLVLSAFSALNFIVSIGTDATYRTTFLEPALDEVRRGLEVRDECTALVSAGGQDGSTPHEDRAPQPRA
ncbi:MULTISPECIES: hypothetical protein [Kocuria]|uniref:hypothetical protein n=1 Tax=Kocuria TaxID=57493 RepID=UPI0006D7733C|nr:MULTISPECIES: hypothetical protein [Kocuria]MDN5632374.1 hypothetical protein [Kocuria sp.]